MKKHFFIFTFLILLIVVISTLTNPSPTKVVMAGSVDNLSGWAWGENIGWISFNCTNTSSCATVDYGVNVDISTGDFSGKAWSENIGWVSFEGSDTSGCLLVPCQANVNLATGVVNGWARACAGTVNGDCTGADRTDGWDGWIQLSDAWANGVSFNTTSNEFSGYAWGSDVVGWIDFSPVFAGNSSFGVTFTRPNTPPLTPDISGPVTGVVNTIISSFTASSTDPEGDNLLYRIDWNNNNTVDESTAITTSGVYSSLPSHSWTSPGTYAFKVLAEDVNGAQSGWRSYSITISNPQCSDGSDNDSDGWTDYPADPGCTSLTDNSESPNPQCSDLVDNDGDGDIDDSSINAVNPDAGCTGISDNDESNCGDNVCNGNETYFSCPQDGCTLQVQEF